ncbi:ABC transporter permease [Sutcliffiella halmapala]|uniref:ABC transporter permease n=1 Tax=Sutcliffiella halmapala TaxID=79882 RepID=UPI0009951EA5|nr:ABC transporter permease [Sutcliffiella halmapala]
MFFLNKFGFTYLSYKALYSFQTLRLFILFRILDPFMHYLFFATLASAIVGQEYLSYVVLGNIVYYTGQTMMINFMSMFRNERKFGTLELNIASPTSTFVIIMRKALVPFLDGLFVFIAGLTIARVLFSIALPLDQIGHLLLLFTVTMFSLLSFALLFACISLLFSNVNLFLNLVLASFQVLCGVNFSVALLPGSLEALARILPLTHSIEAIRSIYQLESYAILPLLGKELMIGGCYFLIALLLVNVMEKLARKQGALFKNV